MILGIHHTGLSVRDLESAIDYYCTDGAFEVVEQYALSDTPDDRALAISNHAQAKIALLKGTTGFLELFQFAGTEAMPVTPHPVHATGIRHICLQDKHIDPYFDHHLSAGASSHARPSGLGTGALYAYIRDPEGNVLELEGVPWSSTDGVPPWYAHTALVTSNIKRLSAFYEELTSVKVHRKGHFGPDKKFDTVAGLEGVEFKGAWIQLPVGVIEMWEYTTPKSDQTERHSLVEPGWSHLSFEVDDIDAAYHRVREMGVKTHGTPLDLNHAQSFRGRDPDGNIIEFFKPHADRADLSVRNLAGLDFLKVLKQDVVKFYQSGAPLD